MLVLLIHFVSVPSGLGAVKTFVRVIAAVLRSGKRA